MRKLPKKDGPLRLVDRPDPKPPPLGDEREPIGRTG